MESIAFCKKEIFLEEEGLDIGHLRFDALIYLTLLIRGNGARKLIRMVEKEKETRLLIAGDRRIEEIQLCIEEL